jgi:large subunit ribosomal protein L21
VKVGDKIKIEKLEVEEGKQVIFDQVLLLENKNDIEIGAPFIKSVKVEGKVLRTFKNKKVVGIKFKAKKRYKVKFGHRQPLTEVEITKIA